MDPKPGERQCCTSLPLANAQDAGATGLRAEPVTVRPKRFFLQFFPFFPPPLEPSGASSLPFCTIFPRRVVRIVEYPLGFSLRCLPVDSVSFLPWGAVLLGFSGPELSLSNEDSSQPAPVSFEGTAISDFFCTPSFYLISLNGLHLAQAHPTSSFGTFLLQWAFRPLITHSRSVLVSDYWQSDKQASSSKPAS